MNITITKESLRQHWSYSKLKYFIVIVAAIVGWSLFYTVTAYRPPTDKKCDFYIVGPGDQQMLNSYLENVRVTDLPEMEQMTSAFITTDDYYSSMQIVTWIAAQEGTVYLMPASQFQNYAAGEYFIPLEDYTTLVEKCEALGIAIDKGWRTVSETGERHLFGIPANLLTGLHSFGVMTNNMYLVVPSTHGNNDVAAQFIEILLRDMIPANQ